jgi:hypothetical protein
MYVTRNSLTQRHKLFQKTGYTLGTHCTVYVYIYVYAQMGKSV